jgi:hypothetical protein
LARPCAMQEASKALELRILIPLHTLCDESAVPAVFILCSWESSTAASLSRAGHSVAVDDLRFHLNRHRKLTGCVARLLVFPTRWRASNHPPRTRATAVPPTSVVSHHRRPLFLPESLVDGATMCQLL